MERTYAAELDADNTVVQVIVGTAQWATEMLGGRWVDTPDKCGPGWTWDGEQIVPPPSPVLDPDSDELLDGLAES